MGTAEEQDKHLGALVLRRDFPTLGPYVAPRTPIERKLADIYCDALGMDQVSVTDHFEELGGDSLIAASICTGIENAFAITVPIDSVVRLPTIEQLAPTIDGMVSKREV